MKSEIDREALRASAVLLIAGELLSVAAGVFHPDGQPANDHARAFAEYASSSMWTAIHLGQFAGMALIIGGLVALFFASTPSRWDGRLGVVAAVAALSLYGMLQAVDGVALKQAVDAWASASEMDKAARFASAETMRWLEWGVRSYQSFMLGMSFLLFGSMLLRAAPGLIPVGLLLGLSGVAYIAQGWVLGAEGFSSANAAPTLIGIAAVVLASVWMAIVAFRLKALRAPSSHR